VSDGEITEGGDWFDEGLASAARPDGSEQNDRERGEEEQKIAPTGGAQRGFDGEEEVCVGERGEQENEAEPERERAKAGTGGHPGTKEEAE